MNVCEVHGCPKGARCEGCGRDVEVTVEVRLVGGIGWGCVTVCKWCALSPEPIAIGPAAAERIVAQHARHLGVDVEELDARGLGDGPRSRERIRRPA